MNVMGVSNVKGTFWIPLFLTIRKTASVLAVTWKTANSTLLRRPLNTVSCMKIAQQLPIVKPAPVEHNIALEDINVYL